MNLNQSGQTHDQLQAACWRAALRLYHPFLDQRLFCIPNDMYAGNVVRWKQYEALGVTPGIWDMQLIWFEQIQQTNGLCSKCLTVQATHWFEFKAGRDDLSKAQLKFQARMEKIGHAFHVISEEDVFFSNLKLIIEPTLHIAKEIWKEEYELNGERKARVKGK
jgi:hypothetical protein